jgi:hypothetical protein
LPLGPDPLPVSSGTKAPKRGRNDPNDLGAAYLYLFQPTLLSQCAAKNGRHAPREHDARGNHRAQRQRAHVRLGQCDSILAQILS